MGSLGRQIPRSDSTFFLETLGRLSLRGTAGDTVRIEPQPLVLLALLVDAHPAALTREFLVDLLWHPGREGGRHSLSQALYVLRRGTGAELIRNVKGGRLGLNTELVDSDLRRFRKAVREEDYSAISRLGPGRFLGDYEGDHTREWDLWRSRVNQEMTSGLRLATQRLAMGDLAAGRLDAAIERSHQFYQQNALDHRGFQLYLDCLVASGRHLEALQAFDSHASLLEGLVQDVPSEELKARIDVLRQGLEDAIEDSPRAEVSRAARYTASALPKSPTRRTNRRLVSTVVATAGVMILGLIAGAWLGSTFESVTPEGDVPDAMFLIELEQPFGETRFGHFSTGDGSMTPVPEAAQHDAPSPSTSLVATRVGTLQGYDLALVDLRTRDTIRITDRPNDERPLAWSPDGRRLLYRFGLFDDDGAYRERFAVYDIESELHHTFPGVEPDPAGRADWHPLGTVIALSALVEGRPTVVVTDAVGRKVTSMGVVPSPSRNPSWSFDGEWLAFERIDGGNHDIMLLTESGTVVPLLTGAWEERDPIWLSERRFAVISAHRGNPGLFTLTLDPALPIWAASAGLNAVSAESLEVLFPDQQVRRIHRRISPSAARSWLEEVRIGPHIGPVSPGLTVPIGIDLVDRDGEPMAPESFLIRWSVVEADRATITDQGLLTVLGTGSITVIADIDGWRVDTLRLKSGVVGINDTDPVSDEDWSKGIQPERWIPFGNPLPLTLPNGGLDNGPRFVNNGDGSFVSGVITRMSIPVADGVTVEAWGSVPITRATAQAFAMVLDREQRITESGDRIGNDTSILEMMVTQEAGVVVTLFWVDQELVCRLPMPTAADWHLYAIALDRARRGTLFIDGQLRCSSTIAASEPLDSAFVILQGHSVDATVSHGYTRVDLGMRYVNRAPPHG